MTFFELNADDISSLNDGDLRDLVARLCEAELLQQGIQPSCVTWGGAQEAADGGIDVKVKCTGTLSNPNFLPKENTGFQVKKHSMGKAACRKEMEESGKPKRMLELLAAQKGSYIIVSGKDDCSEKMLLDRVSGMREAVDTLKNKDDLHLDFYGRDRLSTWLRRHPSVALWVRFRLGKPLAGWKPFGRWAGTPPTQDDAYLTDEQPCVIEENSSSKDSKSIAEGIHIAREKLRRPGSTVRITGLSGVGKTRFAQALFESSIGSDALPASDVIYADLGDDLMPTASQIVTYLIANQFATYLVLDNCPPDVHRNLQKQVSASSANLHLLTIEYDISEDKPEETDVIRLEPSSEQTVSKLIQRRFPDLGQINADRVAEFSGGNARVALVLANRVDADETLSNFSDEDLFQRLFSQRKGHSPELQRSAEVLALAYSFNISPKDYCDELSALGRIAGITRQILRRGHADLLRRQLAQQRGDWRAILPHALANRLAKNALENISAEDINSELLKPENLRLLQSCAHRLGYLHDFKLARELALTWLQPGAPLASVASCNEEYLVILDYIAPIFPELALQTIEKAAEDPDFASRKNQNFTRLVRLLLRLAYEEITFDRTVAVLLKFAETEILGERNDSVVGYMKQLFSLYLSGTEAKPDRRQAFVRTLLESGRRRHREIAGDLLESAFEANSWTSFGTFYFGARQRGPGWVPETNRERTGWYVGYLQLLQPILISEDRHDREWAKAIVVSNFRRLWSSVGCFDILEKIVQDHGGDGRWPEIWMSIKSTIAFDGDRFNFELTARLEFLEKMSAPSDIYSEIEAYVLVDTWEHVKRSDNNFEDESEEIHAKVLKLGQLASLEPDYYNRLGAKLWDNHVRPLIWFGQGLALGAPEKFLNFDCLISSFKKYRSGKSNILVIEGYIKGAYEADPNIGMNILEHALNIPELKSNSVNLLLSIPIIRPTLEKLLKLAYEGEILAHCFEQISYGRLHEEIQDIDLVPLLANINELDRGFFSVIKIMSMRIYEANKRGYVPSEELNSVARRAIRKLFSACRDDCQIAHSYGIDRVVKEVFNQTAPVSEVKEIIAELCAGVRSYRIRAYELNEIISMLVKKYPEIFLDNIFYNDEVDENMSYLIFKENLYRDGSSLNGAPFDKVLKWCESNQKRIMGVAKSLHAYSSVDSDVEMDDPKQLVLSEQIKALLVLAHDKEAFVDIIYKNIYPRNWSGSLATMLEIRSNAFAQLLEYTSPEIQAFVNTKLNILRQRVRDERDKESAEYNEREQRFE